MLQISENRVSVEFFCATECDAGIKCMAHSYFTILSTEVSQHMLTSWLQIPHAVTWMQAGNPCFPSHMQMTVGEKSVSTTFKPSSVS